MINKPPTAATQEKIDAQIAIGMELIEEWREVLQALADNPIDHTLQAPPIAPREKQ